MALSVIGAVLLVAGLITNSLQEGGGGSASVGGVVVIGPIPIVFGTDRTALLMGVIGAVILLVILLAFFFVAARTARQSDSSALQARCTTWQS
jgi:uncharacterized protein (TIGR00304 family)